MKLLNCRVCHDILALDHHPRRCRCGLCYGRYTDDRQAEYAGPGRVLGLGNRDYVRMILSPVYRGEIWTIPDVGDNVRRLGG